MSTFSKLSEVTDYASYKKGIKTALGKLRPGTKAAFIYVEKFKFADKERPMVIVDYDKALVTGLGAATGQGKCSVSVHDQFEFDIEKGKAPVDKLKHVLKEASVPREVSDPDAKPSADVALPAKLDMAYGWTEMRSWDDAAKALVDKFDALVKVYKALPEVPPHLTAQHTDLKQKMAALITSKTENNTPARRKRQDEVEARIADVQALVAAIRKPPLAIPKAADTVAPKTAEKVPEKAPEKPAAEDASVRIQRDAEAEKQRLLAAEREAKLKQAVDEALDTLGTERDGYAALAKRLTAFAAGAGKDKAGVTFKAEVATLEKTIADTFKKNLNTSGMGKFAPSATTLDAYETALKAARTGLSVAAADVGKAQERLDALAARRGDFEDAANDLDPAVRAKRASPTARKVRGYIWRGVYDECEVKATKKDIVGIIGQERVGRSSPDGNSNHVHIGGNAQYNVLFHEVGDAVRVLGFVNGHMDKRMPPSVRSEAAKVELRAKSGNGDFFAVEVDLSARTLAKVAAT